jgi:hypothetical protein
VTIYLHCVHCIDCEQGTPAHEDPCDAKGCPGGQPTEMETPV